MIHAGVIVHIANGEVTVDEWGNVFAGKSWVGRLEDGQSLDSFLVGVVKKYYRQNGAFVIRTKDFDIFVDGCGRVFKDSEIVFGPSWGEC